MTRKIDEEQLQQNISRILLELVSAVLNEEVDIDMFSIDDEVVPISDNGIVLDYAYTGVRSFCFKVKPHI